MAIENHGKHRGDEGPSSRARVGEPSSTDNLARYRVQFPILAQTNYLISNSLGAVPAKVSDEPAILLRDMGEPRRARMGRFVVDTRLRTWEIWSRR